MNVISLNDSQSFLWRMKVLGQRHCKHIWGSNPNRERMVELTSQMKRNLKELQLSNDLGTVLNIKENFLISSES